MKKYKYLYGGRGSGKSWKIKENAERYIKDEMTFSELKEALKMMATIYPEDTDTQTPESMQTYPIDPPKETRKERILTYHESLSFYLYFYPRVKKIGKPSAGYIRAILKRKTVKSLTPIRQNIAGGRK